MQKFLHLSCTLFTWKLRKTGVKFLVWLAQPWPIKLILITFVSMGKKILLIWNLVKSQILFPLHYDICIPTVFFLIVFTRCPRSFCRFPVGKTGGKRRPPPGLSWLGDQHSTSDRARQRVQDWWVAWVDSHPVRLSARLQWQFTSSVRLCFTRDQRQSDQLDGKLLPNRFPSSVAPLPIPRGLQSTNGVAPLALGSPVPAWGVAWLSTQLRRSAAFSPAQIAREGDDVLQKTILGSKVDCFILTFYCLIIHKMNISLFCSIETSS